MMPVPLRGINLACRSSSTAGMRNASVLPEPVRAAPSTSRPDSRCGTVRACTSVMYVKPMSAMPFAVSSDTSSVLNSMALMMPSTLCSCFSTTSTSRSICIPFPFLLCW